MGITASQLSAEVSVQGVDEGKSKLLDMGNAVSKAGGILKAGLGGALSFSAGVAGQALSFLKDQLVDSVQDAIAHQQVMAQTAQAIKSTGDASGETAQSIGDLATSLSQMTPFSEDAVQSGENLLLTFTGIGKQVFPDATKAMLDLSQATGQDMKSSAIQLGKALNDPLTGMSALQRVGVTFSAAEQQQIKTMMAHNDIIGAQKVMLAELNTEFGGSAEAAGKTLGGAMQILRDRLEDVKTKIGTALIPILSQFVGAVSNAAMPILEKFSDWFINDAAPAIGRFGDLVGNVMTYVGDVLKTVNLMDFRDAWQAVSVVVQQVTQDFGKVGAAIHPVSVDFDPLADIIQKLAQGGLNVLSGLLWGISEAFVAVDKSVQTGKGPLADFGNAITQFGPPLQHIGALLAGEFGRELKDIGALVKQVAGWFVTDVVPALRQAEPGFAKLAMTILTTVIPAMIQIRGIVVDVIEHAFKVFGPIIEQIIPPLIVVAGIIAGDLSDALKFLMPYILQAAKAIGDFADEIMDRIAPIIKQFVAQATTDIQEFSRIWAVLWPGLSVVLKGVWDVMRGVIEVAFSVIKGIILVALDIISGNWSQAWNDLKDMLSGVLSGLQTAISGGLQIIVGLAQTAWAGLSAILTKPFNDAWNAIQGVISNIQGAISNVSNAIGGVANSLPHFAGGTSSAPGGFALVGESGPELMYVPRGAQIVPNNQLSSVFGGGQSLPGSNASANAQPIILQIDGQTIGRIMMPLVVNQIRNRVGVRI